MTRPTDELRVTSDGCSASSVRATSASAWSLSSIRAATVRERFQCAWTRREERSAQRTLRGILFACFSLSAPVLAETPSAGDDVVLRAMVDELQRSMLHLEMEDLPKPYFIQLRARDRRVNSISAAYGGLQRSDERRVRDFISRARVGDLSLDNTNFARGSGRSSVLPLDDDYQALRHAMWLTLDDDYKQSVETLTAKVAYLKDTHVEDRPDDFSPAPPVQATEPRPTIAFDRPAWEQRIRDLSARFEKFPKIQDADVSLIAGTETEWLVNSEGSRIRGSDTGIWIRINAEIQAEDGMRLSDSRTYLGETPEQLPPAEKMFAAVDELCTQLIALASAPTLEQYSGPVLLEPEAAATAFESLLGDRLAARATPIGSGGRDDSFEKKLGLRVLPRSFRIYDDPRTKMLGDTVLAGSYRFDEEGTPPQRVDLVEKGVLKALVSGRGPTRKVKTTNGHARAQGYTDARATIGCLYIADDNGLSPEDLRKELRDAAREEGLEFALRISAVEDGGGGAIGDPVYAYKVHAETGAETLVRGLKFQPVEPKTLKRILAGGAQTAVHNSLSGIATSVIAPAVLFEELELSKTQQEFDKPPILPSPATRSH